MRGSLGIFGSFILPLTSYFYEKEKTQTEMMLMTSFIYFLLYRISQKIIRESFKSNFVKAKFPSQQLKIEDFDALLQKMEDFLKEEGYPPLTQFTPEMIEDFVDFLLNYEEDISSRLKIITLLVKLGADAEDLDLEDVHAYNFSQEEGKTSLLWQAATAVNKHKGSLKNQLRQIPKDIEEIIEANKHYIQAHP